MNAIEFQAIVKNGVIEIPGEYLKNLADHVRVIILAEQSPKAIVNLIDQLLAHPVQLQDFQPLTREQAHAR